MIDQLLETKSVSLYQTVYILAFAAENIPEEDVPEKYLELLSSDVPYFKDKVPDYKLSASEFSLALMSMLKINGGVMYSLFKSPHYAFKELIFRGIIQKDLSEKDKVSGEIMLKIVQRAMKWKEKYIK
jgi:hypothetical protein